MSDAESQSPAADAELGASVEIGDERQVPVQEREVPVTELCHWIYRFFYSKTVGLILILLMAFYAVIGSVIAQAGSGVYQDPAAKASFLERMQEAYGGWAPVLNALGFFHAYTSIGFYVVVVMLGLSIIACTVHRIPELIRRKNDPRVHVSNKFFERARYRGQVTSPVSATQSLEITEEVLKANRFRVLPDPRSNGRAIYADKNAWSGIGTVIAHLSFIIILLAFFISGVWGLEDDIAVPVGGTVEVGHGTDLTLTALSFQDTYTEEGQPSDYVSVLRLEDGGTVVEEQEVRVNTPLTYKGYRFHQASFGIAADVTVENATGEVLYDQSVPMKWSANNGQNAVGRFYLPGTDLEVIVVTPASGATASSVPVGSAVFELYQGEESNAVGQVAVPQGASAEIDGYKFSFERERQYTGITMRQDPGTIWMWIGSVLLVVGMTITFAFQYRRVWIRVDDVDGGSRVRFGAVSRLDYSYQRMFEGLVAQVDENLAATSEAGLLETSEEDRG